MKRFVAILITVYCLFAFTVNASAAASNSYVYNSDKKAVAVPEPYRVADYLDGEYAGLKLNSPTDICASDNGMVYILDAANNRIVRLNNDLGFNAEIRLTNGGKAVAFSEAKGIFVGNDEKIYVADKGAKKVYVALNDGSIIAEIVSPAEDLVDEDFEYTPISVIADTAGIVYVISSGSYAGALQYDAEYNFLGFYGSEQVAVTAKVLLNEFWKKILSEDAASGLTRNVPTSIIALDIDDKNFVYTLRGGSSQNNTGQVRKLNTLGANVLLNSQGAVGTYGDTDTYYDSAKNLTVSSSLCDLAVDDDGFITLLDRTYNRLFQYDQSTNMLYAFGGSESRLGNFKSPVAVETLDDRLLVLDSELNSITVFEPTDFAHSVRNAVLLNEDGKYIDAAQYWKKALSYDAYYELANNGMGTVCEEQGDYESAMTYYKLAENKEGYSSAFASMRDEQIKDNFLLLLICVVLLMLIIVAAMIYSERHRKNEYNLKITKFRYPFYCLRHPFKGYYELKVDKKGSLVAANVILLCVFFVSILRERLTAFHFSSKDPEDFNILLTLGSTIGIFLLFVLCNWASSTLSDGEGTFREIWIFGAYSLIPYCISSVVMTVISHIFSLEEAAFWATFWVIAICWTAIHIFMAIREVHQYTTKRAIGVLAITVLGMYLMLLIITLGYSLFTQLLGFISTVFSEYRLK